MRRKRERREKTALLSTGKVTDEDNYSQRRCAAKRFQRASPSTRGGFMVLGDVRRGPEPSDL